MSLRVDRSVFEAVILGTRSLPELVTSDAVGVQGDPAGFDQLDDALIDFDIRLDLVPIGI